MGVINETFGALPEKAFTDILEKIHYIIAEPIYTEISTISKTIFSF
jgi:hypothetical protein